MNIFLSKNLKFLRKEKGISQEELAQSLGVTRNKISSYEGKGIEPKLSLLLKLSKFFQVSVDDIVTYELSKENIETRKSDYLSNISKNNSIGTKDVNPYQLNATIDTKLVRQFIANNERSYKMLVGFKSFYQLKASNNNHEVNNLLIILDHVLAVNKTFVHNLRHKLKV